MQCFHRVDKELQMHHELEIENVILHPKFFVVATMSH